ncbi:MAG: hypothetical protein VZS44_12385 [Bacilli bacterium]|nr:hypothetical protein [Bacilli bacterium]
MLDSKTDNDKCTVKIETPKDKQLEKATETEKSTGAVVYNAIAETLKTLK